MNQILFTILSDNLFVLIFINTTNIICNQKIITKMTIFNKRMQSPLYKIK